MGLHSSAEKLGRIQRLDRLAGAVLGLAGMASMGVGGYLGGYLSYSRGVGVNNAFYQHQPEEWTAVIAEGELTDGKPARVQAGSAAALLYRSNGRICAIGSPCSHAGGPLEEGDIDDENGTVQCPWHQSVFRLDDGSVVHGPASVPQASYEVRVRGGQVEIRQQA